MLSLFSLGNSYSQITDHILEIYGVHFSKPAITAVTDKSLLQEWKKRPLESIYPFIYLVTPEKPKHHPKTGTLEAIKGYNINQETYTNQTNTWSKQVSKLLPRSPKNNQL